MGESQNTVWLFLKNFSNKFSISLVNGNDKKGGGSGTTTRRKYVSYNKLDTHDKGDFLSSSNPNLFDIVGTGTDKGSVEETMTTTTNSPTDTDIDSNHTPGGKNQSGNHKSQSPPRVSSEVTMARFGFGAFSGNTNNNRNTNKSSSSTGGGGGGGEKVAASTTTKKFTFPTGRVPSYQDQEEEKDTGSENFDNDNENWFGDGGDYLDEDDDVSEDEEEDDEDFGSASRKNRCGYCGCEKKYEVA